MATKLTVNILRKSILDLITSSLENPESELRKSLTTIINNLTKQAIDVDNENDINWDEVDELFGEYNPDPVDPTPTPTPTSSSTPTPTDTPTSSSLPS